MKKHYYFTVLASLFVLGGCASPHVVTEKEVTDDKLSCTELVAEIKDAEKFAEKAREEKGVTGTNVAAAVFFWPAIIATYANSEDAIEAAEARMEHLHEISEKKGC